MQPKRWHPTPADAVFEFDAKALKKHWSRLHREDCEPFPTATTLAERLRQSEDEPAADTVAAGVQDAWRAYHSGDFKRAFDLGAKLGLPGFAVTLKAVGVYASEVTRNEREAQKLLLNASQWAEDVVAKLPEDPNAHYLLAFTLGRYSQRTSIVEAMRHGYAGKIAASLQRTLQLAPKHADAHIALGLYHAEIVARLGSLAARLTYGASAAKAIEHFKKAIQLNPDAPIGHLEFANALRLLDEKAHAEEIVKQLELAAECEPADAMEWLDRDRARKLLR